MQHFPLSYGYLFLFSYWNLDEMGRRNSVEKNFRDSMSEMYDTIPLYEDFETQIVNLEEDTQVVDFDAETQLIDDQCCYENLETQIVDDFDTQVVFDSDSEGRDKIEKLHLGDETSDDSDSIGQKEKKINCNGESRGQDAAAALSDELCGSGETFDTTLDTSISPFLSLKDCICIFE